MSPSKEVHRLFTSVGKHVDLRVLLLTADYFKKMPYKVLFFYYQQRGQVMFYMISGDFFNKFHRLILFFFHHELNTGNNNRSETLKRSIIDEKIQSKSIY